MPRQAFALRGAAAYLCCLIDAACCAQAHAAYGDYDCCLRYYAEATLLF